jgi:transcription elongation factor GreA
MTNTGKVIFGTTVDLFNVAAEEEITYQIVGDDEADLAQGKISYKAPIARALIGKQTDDLIEFQAPSGLQEYEIIAVRYE